MPITPPGSRKNSISMPVTRHAPERKEGEIKDDQNRRRTPLAAPRVRISTVGGRSVVESPRPRSTTQIDLEQSASEKSRARLMLEIGNKLAKIKREVEVKKNGAYRTKNLVGALKEASRLADKDCPEYVGQLFEHCIAALNPAWSVYSDPDSRREILTMACRLNELAPQDAVKNKALLVNGLCSPVDGMKRFNAFVHEVGQLRRFCDLDEAEFSQVAADIQKNLEHRGSPPQLDELQYVFKNPVLESHRRALAMLDCAHAARRLKGVDNLQAGPIERAMCGAFIKDARQYKEILIGFLYYAIERPGMSGLSADLQGLMDSGGKFWYRSSEGVRRNFSPLTGTSGISAIQALIDQYAPPLHIDGFDAEIVPA